MPLLLADAADLVDKAINKVWLKESSKEDRSFTEIYGVETGITDYYTKESSISGLGYAGRIVENAAPTEKVPVQGYDKTYTQCQYGVIFTVSKMMWKFGVKKRNLEQLTREVINAVANLRSKRLYEKLTNAWSTSYVASDISGSYSISIVGGDGVELVSIAHTREDAGTNNNNQITDGTTVNMDFDYDGLKAAHRTAQLILDPNGLPMDINLDTIVVAKNTANHFKAMELLGSIKKGQISESADNDGSGLETFKVHASRWLSTNPNYWFMMDASMKDDKYGSLQYKEAQPITLSPVNIIYKTEELQWKAEAIFDYGHNEYRNLVGSKGTNAS